MTGCLVDNKLKALEGSGRGGIFLEGLRKPAKTFRHYTWYPVQDLNPGPSEY